MAQTIWQFRRDTCASAPQDEALGLIMAKLAQ